MSDTAVTPTTTAPATTTTGPAAVELPEFIYHVCESARWVECLSKSYYYPTTLETEGFIHCSTEDQVMTVLKNYYSVTDPETSTVLRDKTTGETTLLLLRIATAFPGFAKPAQSYKEFHATATPEMVADAGCVLIMEPPMHPKVTAEGQEAAEGIAFVEGAPLFPHAYGCIPVCSVDDAVKIFVDPAAGYTYGATPYTFTE